MTRIILDSQAVAEFIIEEAVLDLSPSLARSVGVLGKDGAVQGGVLYANYTGLGGSVAVHMAGNGRHWASRDFLWTVFDYAFSQMFVEKIFGPVSSGNEHSIDVCLRLGFTLETKLAKAFHTDDLLIFSMVPSQCRWLNYRPRQVTPGFGSLFNIFAGAGDT